MKIGFVWETNAWKSTLFNKFFGSFRAIVTDISWTTRENISEKIKWDDEWNEVLIYDSPWLTKFQDEFKYIKRIIDKSDIIVFVLDGKWWINENINIIASYIRKVWKDKKTIVAVNKIDTTSPTKMELALADFYNLWFDDYIAISAKHNFHLVELKEKIDALREKYNIPFETKKEKNTSFTLVGRINVWKSTLFNAIIWKDWSRVSKEWWTTLDYLTYPVNYAWKKYEIIDTAWFRRKWKIHWLEKIAVKDKLDGMIKYKKPIIVVLFDISEWITHRDMTVLWEMLEKNLPIIVAFNKIDNVSNELIKNYTKELKNWMRFAPWIPIVMISWKEKKWFKQLFKMIDMVDKYNSIDISTNEINELIQTHFIANPPRLPKNKNVKVKYIIQDKENKNEFIVFVNMKDKVNFAFKKWLENVIRKKYWFIWIPLIFYFRESKKWDEHVKNRNWKTNE